MDEKKLRRKNRLKVVRTVIELVIILAVVAGAVAALISYRYQEKQLHPDPELNAVMASGSDVIAGLTPVGKAVGNHFIVVSYNGLTDTVRKNGRIVTRAAYEEQLQTLKASGYQTITQRDLIDFYENGTPLPEKALFLLFEDGIMNTTLLAYPALRENNYIATACTFAGNLTEDEGRYISTKEMQKLSRTTYWETGSNGYRLSYINVFDRFDNYFGNLSAAEFQDVSGYLRRDYNHYLMDFIRNENRIRTESVAEMEERIASDYTKMQEVYEDELGYTPALYVLMHSNTGAFGNDPLVSRKNGEMMQSLFSLNFNRQGSCLNTRDSSPYDLTRLQSREYFSTNHLMMRIWDDTGHDVVFRLGDLGKSDEWNRLSGVGEFKDRKIILTTLPYGEGEIRLARDLPEDVEVSVRLQGNVVGQQSVKLRADENGNGGVCVRLYDNVLLIEDGEGNEPLFSLDLFGFDGEPPVSLPELELMGRIALAETIIENDKDESRVADARLALETLRTIRAPGVDEGAEPYIPELDISAHGDRELRIRLVGGSVSVWLDGIPVAEALPVSAGAGRAFFLESAVTRGSERFSKENLSDDVYDGVFTELSITDPDGGELFTYVDPLPILESGPVGRALDGIIDFFHHFSSLRREE